MSARDNSSISRGDPWDSVRSSRKVAIVLGYENLPRPRSHARRPMRWQGHAGSRIVRAAGEVLRPPSLFKPARAHDIERRDAGAEHPPDRVARRPQVPRDLLDRLALD